MSMITKGNTDTLSAISGVFINPFLQSFFDIFLFNNNVFKEKECYAHYAENGKYFKY